MTVDLRVRRVWAAMVWRHACSRRRLLVSCHRGDVRSMLAENDTRYTTVDARIGRNITRRADNKVAGGANVSEKMLLVVYVREDVLLHRGVVLAAFLAGTGVGTERGERQQGARNTEKVDPSTNRRSVCNATVLRLVMRPGVVM
jgi:hypothetical protein